MKVWVTKYALTEGIREVDEAERTVVDPDMITVWFSREFFHGEGRDWHLTKESAVLRANAMVAAKLESLRKSIKKLEAIRFGSDGTPHET